MGNTPDGSPLNSQIGGMDHSYTPYPYQLSAIEYMLQHPHSLICLGMGLGKTAITLEAICRLRAEGKISRVLIIAPKYVAQDTWIREVSKWGFPLTCAVAIGTPAKRRKALAAGADITTISRDLVCWLVNEYGGALPYDCIVIDESSSFKSPSAQRWKALKRLTPKIPYVYELTGTPMPTGSLEALWAQVYLLDSGARLGKSLTAFRARYERPGRGYQGIVYEWLPRDGAKEEVFETIADCSMSMSSADYLQVPDEIIVDHHCTLPAAARRQYRQLESAYVLTMDSGADVWAQQAGVLAGKLHQMAQGAVYNEYGVVEEIHTEKLAVLDEILEATEEPVIVYYHYQHDYDRLMEHLAAYSPRTIRSAADIADWNAGKIRILLAHPASMGHGLNLQAGGHIIIWYCLTYSLELYQQANARLHRTGQQHAVQVHRIVCDGTVDDQIVAALERKDGSQRAYLEAVRAAIVGGDQA